MPSCLGGSKIHSSYNLYKFAIKFDFLIVICYKTISIFRAIAFYGEKLAFFDKNKEKNKLASQRLYTESIKDPEMKKMVWAIPASKGGDSFRTEGFQVFPLKAGGSEYEIRWRKASRQPETHSWKVVEYATKPAFHNQALYDDIDIQKRTVRSDLCFLDALHNCAVFETGEASLNPGAVDITTYEPDVPHYRDFAETEGQSFNRQGLPVPAAHGEVLLDGSHPEKSYENARKTKDIALLAPDSFKKKGVSLSGGLDEASLSTFIDGLDQKAETVRVERTESTALAKKDQALSRKVDQFSRQFDNVVDAAMKLDESFNKVANYKRDHDKNQDDVIRWRDNQLDRHRHFNLENAVFNQGVANGLLSAMGTGVVYITLNAAGVPGFSGLTGAETAVVLGSGGALPVTFYTLWHTTPVLQHAGAGIAKVASRISHSLSTSYSTMKSLLNFKLKTARLPDGAYKTEMKRLGNSFEVGLPLLRAQQAHEKMEETGSSYAKFRVKHYLKKTFGIAKDKDMGQEMGRAVKTVLEQENGIAHARHTLTDAFDKKCKKLRDLWKENEDAVEADFRKQLTQGEPQSPKALPSPKVG